MVRSEILINGVCAEAEDVCGGALANVKVDTSARENVLSADDVTSVYALGLFWIFWKAVHSFWSFRSCLFLCCLGRCAAGSIALFGVELS